MMTNGKNIEQRTYSSLVRILIAGSCAVGCGPTLPIGTGGAGGTGGANGGSYLPCDVDAVLKNKCRTCHGAQPQFGAPMPLVTYADVQAIRSGQPVWRLMQTRVGNNTMPPNTTLSSEERTTLNNWFNAGAPAGNQVCQNGTTDTTCIGPQCLPCAPNVNFKSYAGLPNSGIKYSVAPGQAYTQFNFTSPFRPGELAVAWAPIVDNRSVIHHWILYGNGGLNGITFVAGWAPGGNNKVMDPDVGLMLDYPSFSLQVHYNNATGTTQTDASGVAFCTTSAGRQNVAGVFTIGTELISVPPYAQSQASGTCTAPVNMTMIGTSPHMHQIGWGFRTEHIRGGVNLPDVSNVPLGQWSFEGQRQYALVPRRAVQVGDVFRTTCYYKNPNPRTVTFGPYTEDEMCFDFTLVYPYGPSTKGCPMGF